MQTIEKSVFLLKMGEQLKEFRKIKGYSNHEALADELNMNRAQYWEYENGKKNITVLTLKKILDKLEVDFSIFFSDWSNKNH